MPKHARATELFRSFFKGHLALRPLEATALGLREHAGELEDLSPAGLRRQAAFYKTWEARLRAFERRCEGEDKLDARRMAELSAFCRRLLQHRPEHPGSLELTVDVYETLILQKLWAKTEGDWRDALARVKALPRFVRDLGRNFDKHAKRLPPDRRLLEDMAPTLEAFAVFLEKELPEAARKKRSRSAAELRRAARPAARALRALSGRLTKLMRKAGESYAIGRTEYAWRLKNVLGMAGSPEAVQARGRRLLEEIQARMRRLALELDPAARGADGLRRLMKKLHEEKVPKNDREMLAMYRGFTERARRFVGAKGLFKIAPDYELGLMLTPEGLDVAPAMYFSAPPLDDTKKGYFLVSPGKGDRARLLTHNAYHALSTAVHEAFPGHDMQYFLWQRLDGAVPPWRFLHGDPKDWSTSMNVEGYAHYAEELMRVHGFYRPKEELFQLAGQAWRAARVVVDIGLHCETMSFEEARTFMEEEAYLDPVTAHNETFRYTRWPTQAVTYALGKLKIEDLKAQARDLQGRSFREASFHDAFLRYGPLPPALLERGLLSKLKN